MNGTEQQPQHKPYSGHRPGDVIADKYELTGLAGEGSTGEVWLATHTTLGMPVALKLLRKRGRSRREGFPTLGENFDADLLKEAQATARVSHSAVVRVLDFGMSAAGDPFIVMERLDGEDLRERLLREGPCPALQAAQLVLPVIHGMHAAHVKGIVHRDLKPENIYLAVDDAGRHLPKVVDFGIANLPWEGNIVVGTPAYMAPEQAAGTEHTDHRADVYSMSIVLYELVAGHTPAALRTADGRSRLSDEACVDRLVERGAIDAPLAAILRRGLMRSPSARFRTMRELGEALAGWLVGHGVEEDVQGVLLASSWLCDGAVRASDTAPIASSHAPRASVDPASTRALPARRGAPRRGLGLVVSGSLVLLAAAGAVGVALGSSGAGDLDTPRLEVRAARVAPTANVAEDERVPAAEPPRGDAAAAGGRRVGTTSVERGAEPVRASPIVRAVDARAPVTPAAAPFAAPLPSGSAPPPPASSADPTAASGSGA